MATFTLIKCASHKPLSQILSHLVSSVHVLVSAQVLARSVAPLVVIITIMSGFLWLDHYNQHHQFTLNIILIVKR